MVSRALIVLFGVLLPVLAWAGSATLSVVAQELEVGQVGAVRVIVEGDRPTAPPVIEIQPAGGLELRFERQGQQVSIVNSNVRRYYEYTYRVEALAAGRYTLGPARIEIGTDALTTNSATLTVTPRDTSSAEVVQAHAGFDVDEAWVGQVVVYRRGLTSRLRIVRDSWTDPPLDGLLPPRDGDPTYREYTVRDQEGDVYFKEEFHPKVLTVEGDREVPSAVARLSLGTGQRSGRGPFAMERTRNEVVLTEPGRLLVRPLPPPPAGFSGLVGDFTFQAALDRSRAAVGESINWTVAVEGNGTLEGFTLPRPTDLAQARIYDGSPATTARVDADGYHAEGRYDRVIVPVKAGRIDLPAVEVVTFSPTRGEYVTHKLQIPPITVAGGKGGAGAAFESFTDTDVVDTDVVYVEDPYEGVRDVRRAAWVTHSPWLGGVLPWVLGLSVAPLVVLGGWSAVDGVRALVQRVARPAAPRDVTPVQRLQRLPSDPMSRLAELDAALRHALARRTGTPLVELDRATAIEELDAELAQVTREATRRLDLARFAGHTDDGLVDVVVAVVRRLEGRGR